MRYNVVVHFEGHKPQHYPDISEEQLESIKKTYTSPPYTKKEIYGKVTVQVKEIEEPALATSGIAMAEPVKKKKATK